MEKTIAARFHPTILHCDLNNFYASVELLSHPELKDLPMAVCGNPENRHGIILAKNEAAKKYQVKTAETIYQAKRKCPQLVLLPPHHKLYREYSQQVNMIYQKYTNQVEPFGIDESWLDVTQSYLLCGDGYEIAKKIQQEIAKTLGLTISVGVSFNKIFAKIGSDYKKPNAITVIGPENYQKIVYPLPVENLLFIGKIAAQKMHSLHIYTIADLAAAEPQLLMHHFGKQGKSFSQFARATYYDPVKPVDQQEEIKSISNGNTFYRNLIGLEDIQTALAVLADKVAVRLRQQKKKAKTISITIKSPDFHSISRQCLLPFATYLASDLYQQALKLVQENWSLQAPIRMITIHAMHLIDEENSEETIQLELFSTLPQQLEQKKQKEQLAHSIDAIRHKYGKSILIPATILKNDWGFYQEEIGQDIEDI